LRELRGAGVRREHLSRNEASIEICSGARRSVVNPADNSIIGDELLDDASWQHAFGTMCHLYGACRQVGASSSNPFGNPLGCSDRAGRFENYEIVGLDMSCD